MLDALVAAHELVYGDKFTPATAKQYLAIDPNTDWESKVFGRETGFHGFYINNDFPTNEAGAGQPKVTVPSCWTAMCWTTLWAATPRTRTTTTPGWRFLRP